jgi:hypothetical protein
MVSIPEDNTSYEKSVQQRLDVGFQHVETIYGWKRKSKVLIYKQRQTIEDNAITGNTN